MEVYNGPYLIIKYEQDNSRLIIFWKSSPPDNETYKKELIAHLHIVKKIKPSQVSNHKTDQNVSYKKI